MRYIAYGILGILVLCLMYVLALQGRTGHKDLSRLRQWSYAHRGLHGHGVPENSMAAFRAALDAGYGIELDVHLLSDGNLAVMHDSNLKRTTGREGQIESLTTAQLADYRLQDTEETIPEFRKVLELFAGRAPLIIELKSADNVEALCQAVCRMLEDYRGLYCIESFDPRCVLWLRRHKPQIIRGQLAENFLKTPGSSVSVVLKWIMTNQAVNFLTCPDFIAYKFADRKTVSNAICRKFWGIQGVSWTLRTKEEYDTAVSEGWIPIFEGFRP